MDEKVRQQLVDDHFLFVSGDKNLIVSGMERDWPEGRWESLAMSTFTVDYHCLCYRGIFHNKDKTFLTWVNEEDQLRIISMQKVSVAPWKPRHTIPGVTKSHFCCKNPGRQHLRLVRQNDHLGVSCDRMTICSCRATA